MNQNLASTVVRKPSGIGSFLGGFKTGAFSGALMMGIVGVVSLFTPLGFTLGIAASTALCTGLFSGTMSVIRGNKSHAGATAAAPQPVRNASPAVSQGRAPQQAVEMDAPVRTSNWTDKVGQRDNRLRQILDKGDKDHAASVLAAREAETSNLSR